MAVMQENAESLYFDYVEIYTLHLVTFFMRKERIKVPHKSQYNI